MMSIHLRKVLSSVWTWAVERLLHNDLGPTGPPLAMMVIARGQRQVQGVDCRRKPIRGSLPPKKRVNCWGGC
jgi:hypothetical protein